jgi:Tol biopolymer transport system component
MKRHLIHRHLPFVAAASLMLSACATPAAEKPRIELPQQFRLPPNDIVTMFEQRNGRIAITSEDGNILIMDQTGGNIVQLTRDASLSNTDAQEATLYTLPIWSRDAKQLALVELTGRRTAVSSTIELNPEAVIVQRGENSSVVEQGPTGSEVKQVEPGMRVERNPSRVVIQHGTGGGEFVSSALYLASADGKRPLREVYVSDANDVTYLDWSPDNSKIAFLTEDVQDQSVAVNLINAQDGARAKRLLEGSTAFWNWHPDGKSLLTKVGSLNGPDRLSVIDVAADKTTRIENPNKGDLGFLAPQYSPDGGFMLLTEESGEKHKLVLADRDGKVLKTLTEFTGRISFAWSPAGARVAYVVQADESEPGGALTVLDVNSGDKRVVSNKPVQAFFWSPDGERIAVFSRANQTDIPPDFQGFSVVPNLAIPLMLLETVDPDNGNARGLFYFAPTTTFQRVVSEFDRWSRSVNIWSPDGRKLVFTLTFGDTTGTRDYVIESEASGSLFPRILGNGGLALWSPK